MGKVTRQEIFAQAARKLRAEFAELTVVPHNALKGHEAEQIVRKFLDAHIPRRFAVGAGFILDSAGTISPQTDVIIYDAFNCPVYRASDDASIFPSNNVVAVVEVKSALDGKELKDGWAKVSAIKSLVKAKPPGGPVVSQTGGFLFAFDSKLSLATLSEQYATLLRADGIGHHIDAICLLDKGIVTLAAKARGVPGWNTMFMEGLGGRAGEGTHVATSAAEFGENALDAFFRLLLPRLMLFRHIVDHPGFGLRDIAAGGQQLLTYVTSFTSERDPKRREAKLLQYAKEVEDEFSKTPAPGGSAG